MNITVNYSVSFGETYARKVSKVGSSIKDLDSGKGYRDTQFLEFLRGFLETRYKRGGIIHVDMSARLKVMRWFELALDLIP